MGDISANFSRYEFACSCGCEFDAADIELVKHLETIREWFGGRVVVVHCACRCLTHNRSLVDKKKKRISKDTSQHVKAMAVDFHIDGVSVDEIADFAETLLVDRGGIGRYDTFVHIDERAEKARWDTRGEQHA